MAEDRGTASSLKGRLADVYVPALLDGALAALSRRLGNRATIDDPLFGRATTLSSIDPLLENVARHFAGRQATYRQVSSTTSVDRDVAEGLLIMQAEPDTLEVPICVVAERRRLREIELRVYYATGVAERTPRAPLLDGSTHVVIPQIVAHVLEAFRKGAVERVLAAFEEASRFVDPMGRQHAKRDGAMSHYLTSLGGRLELIPAGTADDGRTCCIEAVVTRMGALEHPEHPEPAVLSFERGDSGLLRELRLYHEP